MDQSKCSISFFKKKYFFSSANRRDLGHGFASFHQHHCSGCGARAFAKLGCKTAHSTVHAKTRVIFLLQLKQKKLCSKTFFELTLVEKEMGQLRAHVFGCNSINFGVTSPKFRRRTGECPCKISVILVLQLSTKKKFTKLFLSTYTSRRKWINCADMIWL